MRQMWDVGFGFPLRSLVDSGFYPETPQRGVLMAEKVLALLGIDAPVKVCKDVREAEEFARVNGPDAVAIWPFDWDDQSW